MRGWQPHILRWPFLIAPSCVRTVTNPSLVMLSLQFRKAADFPRLGVLWHQERNFSPPSSPLFVVGWSVLSGVQTKLPGSLVVEFYARALGGGFEEIHHDSNINVKTHSITWEGLHFTWHNQSTFAEGTAYELSLLKQVNLLNNSTLQTAILEKDILGHCLFQSSFQVMAMLWHALGTTVQFLSKHSGNLPSIFSHVCTVPYKLRDRGNMTK